MTTTASGVDHSKQLELLSLSEEAARAVLGCTKQAPRAALGYIKAHVGLFGVENWQPVLQKKVGLP